MRHILRMYQNDSHDATMLLALMLWLCVAPFVLLLTIPFFGWQGGLTAVVIALLITLALCWGVCLFPKNPEEAKTNAGGSRLR